MAPGRWRRLTSAQYANTVRDLLGQTPDTALLVTDSRTGPFTSNALFPVQENDVGAYSTLAESLARTAVGNLTTLLGCDTRAMGEDRCATQFIKTFGGRAYRRPLVAAEEAAFAAVYMTGKEESFATGIRLVVEAMLSSPSFLYLVENTAGGGAIRRLGGYELASRLSYFLTGTMPDTALFTAAGNGSLDTAAGVRAQAQRLVASDRFVGEVEKFHLELLGVDALLDDSAVTKDTTRHPGFDAAMRAAMFDEGKRFVRYVMTKGAGSIEELLTSNFVFPAGPLAKVYGPLARPDADGRAQITDGTRKGLLTLAAVQAVHPRLPSPHAAVNRGYMVRRDLLCDVVPAPAVAVEFNLPPNASQLSAQQILRAHQANPTCKACHQLMDSIGFAFESYDPMGAHRTKDGGGNPIDSSGEIVNLAGGGTFANAAEMTDKLARSLQVRACMSTQWLRFALGRDPGDADACSLQQLTQALATGKGNVKDALLAFAASDSFRFTRGE